MVGIISRVVTVLRRRLGGVLSPVEMLRALRDQPLLVGLLGHWCDGDDLIAFAPSRVLSADEDPFDAVRDVPRDLKAADAGFGGGWIGTLGYHLGAALERLPPG